MVSYQETAAESTCRFLGFIHALLNQGFWGWVRKPALKKKLMYLSIYFGRARPSLVCRFFPGYGEHGLLSGCGARASNCSGFLLQSIESRVCRHQYLWCVGSVVVAPWFWREGSVVVVHRFICFTSCGIFPDQG